MIRFQASDGEVRVRKAWGNHPAKAWFVSTRRAGGDVYFFEFGICGEHVSKLLANRELMEWSIHG